MNFDKELDAKGLNCPLPTLRAKKALAADPHLMNGLNVHEGKITYKAVADDLKKKYVPAAEALGL